MNQTNSPSKQALFLGGCIIAIIAFFAGTRSEQLMNTVGPLIGISPTSETINLSSVQRTYQQLKANFDGKLDNQKLIDGASRGLVAAAGDTHTVFYDAEEAKAFNNDLSGNVGAGIGAEIAQRNNQPTVIRLLPNNPAIESGLLVGDQVTAVNSESTVGWDAAKTASLIRGEPGTSVRVTIKRDDKSRSYTITRQTIDNPSVYTTVKDDIGIMTISRFDEQTAALARKAAESFKQQGVKGVVVDIRSDGGGYLDAATETASIWLENAVVATQRKGTTVLDEQRTKSDAPLKNMATVILVNEGSASASEIFAAALHDYGKAKLVGEKTFGKGSVQQVIPLENAAILKVTVAKWYTSKGKNVNGTGLLPDVKVSLSEDEVNSGKDPQLTKALQLIK